MGMGRSAKAEKGGRGKGRAPKKLQKSTAKAAKQATEEHEIFDADMDAQTDRRRNLESVKVRDYDVSDIDSDDDEEIDSDAAFDESDEERFSNFQQFFKDKARASIEGSDSEMGNDEDEEDEGDLVDLSEMLDAGPDDEGEVQAAQAEAQDSDSDELEGFGTSGSESESDDNGEAEHERLSRLDGFVTSISARTPKRRYISEAGAHAEDENAVGSGLGTRGVSLGLGDLLGDSGAATEAGGEGAEARAVRQLREQVTGMERAARRAGAGVAHAPVARRLQDQMDRSVAYAQTKKSVGEWQPTVSANREAEHLSFPLNQAVQRESTKQLATGGTATAMEAQIRDVLAQSGMTDEQQRQYEELELQAQTPEQIRARQRELRMTRDLMFRSERKAKRAAKIKSKAYRRILKRERLRGQEHALAQMQEEDPEMYAMLVEKMARSRAEERMTLRHKNTGKWAQAMARRSHDEGAQQMLREQLEQHDSLKRKIHDLGSDDDVSDYEAGRAANDSASDDDAGDASFEGIRGAALAKLGAAHSDDDELPEGTPHKALFEMKFMRTAMQRKREQADEDALMVRREFEALEADVDADGETRVNRTAAVRAAQNTTSSNVAGAQGRMSFGGGLAGVDADAEDDAEDDDVDSKRVRLDDAGQVSQVASGAGHRVRLDGPLSVAPEPPAATDGEENPWLDNTATSVQRGGAAALSKGSTKLDKLSVRLREQRAAAGAVPGKALAAESVLLDVTQTLMANGDADGDVEMQHVSNPNAFTQRELVEQAFAEDNVVEAEFAQEKEAEAAADAPKDEDLTLPGWGSWGGARIQPKKNKIVRKAVAGIEPKSRLDAKLGSVIINQRQQKSSTKYYASNVPFPYYSSEQYEATMQAPLGKEWNTTKSHSKMIKPRVLTKAGRIIDPISIPSKKHQ